MVYLLHGDNQTASREFLQELVSQAEEKNQELVRLDGLKLEIEDFIQALDSGSLFGGERTIVVENLFSRPKSKTQERMLDFLNGYGGENQLILWERKEVGKRLQKKLPEKTQVKLFKIPVLMFKFLDQLSPYKKTDALKLLSQLLKQESAELIFYMLVRQFRLLIQVSDGVKVSGPPWLTGKLKRQAEAFNKDNLLTNYRRLFTIDESIKTGRTLMGLDWHLDMFLLNL